MVEKEAIEVVFEKDSSSEMNPNQIQDDKKKLITFDKSW